jgi:K+-transporting ATPase ATPase A chain
MISSLLSASIVIPLLSFFIILILLAHPLGLYMARVYTGQVIGLEKIFGPIERLIYRICGINRNVDMSWKHYSASLFVFSVLNILFLYLILHLQHFFPLNPNNLPGITGLKAANIAISFVTNTNWQSYVPEQQLSNFTQMVGLTVQHFISAAVGMAVCVALLRSFIRKHNQAIGNFWVDMVRGILYILLPLSLLFSVLIGSQGVVQTLQSHMDISLLETGKTISVPLGPVASQVAIKQLGTNGGGFFATNAAHPFENPTSLSNLLQLLAMLLIPTALCVTAGSMVMQQKQGSVWLITILVLFLPLLLLGLLAEFNIYPGQEAWQKTHQPLLFQYQGNMEGKETRHGILGSVLWSTASTATSAGALNSSLDSYTPLGRLIPLLNMQLGEIIFGGVGSGLYGLITYTLLTVFLSGLMVGRTPEFLGKKISVFEMKMISLVLLLPPILSMLATMIMMAWLPDLHHPITPHYFTQLLYNMTSAANNNGSSLNGIAMDHPPTHMVTSILMLVGRFGTMLPILALAGALSAKGHTPTSTGTLSTSSGIFITLLIMTILIMGLLGALPHLAMGPIVEHLILLKN